MAIVLLLRRYSTNIIKSHDNYYTKVGVFYVDHMNDDLPEVDSFLMDVT